MIQSISLLAALLVAHSTSAADLIGSVKPLPAPKGRAFAPTRKLEAIPTAEPIDIDGLLTERCWADGEWVTGFYEGRTAVPAKYPILAKIAFDRTHLYFAFRCPEDKLDSLRLLRTERDDPRVWNDDCIEVYLDANRDGETMFHFMINAAGVVTDTSVTERAVPDAAAGVPGVYVYRMKSDRSWSANVQAAAGRGNGEWHLEVSIPVRDLGIGEIVPGSTMGITICRERYCGQTCTGLASLRPNAWAGQIPTYPELRMGEPLVRAICDVPTGRGMNECRLALTNQTAKTHQSEVELTTQSALPIRVAQYVTLAPDEPVEVQLQYSSNSDTHDVSVRGRFDDGRLYLHHRVRGPTPPVIALKVVEHARFLTDPVTNLQVHLNLGNLTAKRTTLSFFLKNPTGEAVAAGTIPAPLAQGSVRIALRTGLGTTEGRYTIECAAREAGKEIGKATATADLVSPPDFGLAKANAK